MRYLIVAVLSLIGCLQLHAQSVKPIYFSGDKVVSDPEYATSYGIVGKLSSDSIYVLKRYDLDDNLLMTGQFKDDILTIPHGDFLFYSDVTTFNIANSTYFNLKGKTRFISQRGKFVEGYEQGAWYFYFPNGSISQQMNFRNGLLEGEFVVYSPKGRKETVGKYADGKKHGN